jgi:acylphosphatase
MRVVVTGRVQGVGFRQWAAHRARALGLLGWVRNRPDGAVEAVAEGPAHALDAWLLQLRDGPPMARVESAAPVFETPIGESTGFEIR